MAVTGSESGAVRKAAWSIGVFVVGLAILVLAGKSATMREARSKEEAAHAVAVSQVASALWAAAERNRQALRTYRGKVAAYSAAMDPRRIVEPEGAAQARDAIDRFRAACAELDVARSASDMRLLQQVNAIPAGGDAPRNVRDALERIEAFGQGLRENQRAQADALLQLVAFLADHADRMTFDNRGPVFNDPADLAAYHTLAQTARGLSNEERQLTESIELATRDEFARLARL
ncbi:hypothetical protein [Noviluteimonas gilva]|uniref:Methyl-accepting chemotaxis protein n=1 Tax=Noviluteimonas gilva TaxID=2682097 RepID=A0A7C9HVU7_9GAMM|nr:hypothetical protein [Lysobacter gilvus]MUV14718.1 hypothetical protein [Lysobacter gilvus]